jgi:hypothetical protein
MNMNDILSQSITSPTPGFGTAVKVLKSGYDKLFSNRNLLTYSTSDIFHSCPRKYQLKKMQAEAGVSERVNSPTFAFGHAVGAGVAVYDETKDIRQALWAAFLAWDIDLLETERKANKSVGKSFYEACWALYSYQEFYNSETNLRDYDSIKIEATIAVDFENGHFYSGHIDEVLQHRETGRFLVKENKTTGLNSVDPVMYQNSDQALSYAIVVDMLGGSEYEVLYTVYSSTAQQWHQFSFVKDSLKKAEWIQDQLLIQHQIDSYSELNFFPKRGRSCYNFMRRCEFLDTCEFSTAHTFGKKFSELPTLHSIQDISAIEQVDFATTLSEIVQRQKERL